MIADEAWKTLWPNVVELGTDFKDVVFIGGIAVYLHSKNQQIDALAAVDLIEFSHDIDLCVSLPDFADMRDAYIVTPARQGGKQQMIMRNRGVDIYVERNHRLAVPYDELKAYAVAYDGLKTACLEHLLILKLDAAADRLASPKGEKDRRDIAKIGLLMDHPGEILLPYLSDDRLALLAHTAKSPVFMEIAQGNAHHAKVLRERFERIWGKINAMAQTAENPPMP